MYDCGIDEPGKALREGHSEKGSRRFPDLRNLHRPRWRDVFVRLAGPALRLHRFRNLRSAMFYDALSRTRDGGQP